MQPIVLTDVCKCIHTPELKLGEAELPAKARGCRVVKHTMHGGLSDGVETVEIDNGRLSVVVLPTRGMGIWAMWLGELRIGWQSPVRGPVHPKFVPLAEPSGLGWLDGFDELLCRCGLVSNGAPEFDERGQLRYGLHGRIANLPARKVELAIADDTGEITLTGVVEETRFLFHQLRMKTTISLAPGENRLRVVDEVTNFSARPGGMELLYHINVGRPLLDAGSALVAPVRDVAPRNARAVEGIAGWKRYGEPTPGFAEQVYLCELAAANDQRTGVLLKNAGGNAAFGLRFRRDQLPCFTLWKNTGAESDGYVTGLEPGTNFPNPRSFEEQHGRVRRLEPGETARFALELAAYDTEAEVKAAEKAVRAIAPDISTTVHAVPEPMWSA
jgi:hypothetical protein